MDKGFKLFPEKWDWDSVIEHVIVHYRWIFVLFLLPISFVFDIYHYSRNWIVFKLSSAPRKHEEKVRKIQKRIREWKDLGSEQPMCTARPGWQTMSPQYMKYKERMFRVQINLVDILEINVENRTVRCEPLVSMGQLTATLDRLGWMIPIVPELDDLTVGGLVMGTGVETSSHKYGLFQHICKSFEVVLADGSVVNCSEDENSELFYSIPWSYGTLGFLLSVEIRLIPSQRFVHVRYYPFQTLEEGVSLFEEKTKGDDDFVESLVFSENISVVMTGNLVSSCDPEKINEIGRWYKPWFFKHVEENLKLGRPKDEYIPLRDYFHRHSRSLFWEIQDIIPFGNNPMFRYIFGWLIPPKVSLLKLTQGKTLKRLYEENHLVQDMLVPISKLKDSLKFFHGELGIYPIWLCPFKLPKRPGMLKISGFKTENGDDIKEHMFVDIGVYGVPKVPGFNNVKTTRKVEEFVRKVRGFQMLYADSYMTREEFGEMFDLSLYEEMRKRYNCRKAFPHVYDKINKKARAGE